MRWESNLSPRLKFQGHHQPIRCLLSQRNLSYHLLMSSYHCHRCRCPKSPRPRRSQYLPRHPRSLNSQLLRWISPKFLFPKLKLACQCLRPKSQRLVHHLHQRRKSPFFHLFPFLPSPFRNLKSPRLLRVHRLLHLNQPRRKMIHMSSLRQRSRSTSKRISQLSRS